LVGQQIDNGSYTEDNWEQLFTKDLIQGGVMDGLLIKLGTIPYSVICKSKEKDEANQCILFSWLGCNNYYSYEIH
jgi:hypothetical protein